MGLFDQRPTRRSPLSPYRGPDWFIVAIVATWLVAIVVLILFVYVVGHFIAKYW